MIMSIFGTGARDRNHEAIGAEDREIKLIFFVEAP